MVRVKIRAIACNWKANMIPDVKEIKNSIVLKRYPRQSECVLGLENGDTYTLGYEALEVVLRLLKVPESLGAADYLWNFYAIQIDLNRMVMKSLSMEQAETLSGRKDPIVF